MNLGTLESEIVTRLNVLSNVDVIALPEDEADFKLPFPKGKITVAIKNTAPDPIRTTGGGISHSEEITIECIIQSKKRTGTSGIYTIYAAAKARLYGFRPTHCDKITECALTHVEHKDGIWTYLMTAKTTTLFVELPDDESLVLARMITLEYNDETIEVETTLPPIPPTP